MTSILDNFRRHALCWKNPRTTKDVTSHSITPLLLESSCGGRSSPSYLLAPLAPSAVSFCERCVDASRNRRFDPRLDGSALSSLPSGFISLGGCSEFSSFFLCTRHCPVHAHSFCLTNPDFLEGGKGSDMVGIEKRLSKGVDRLAQKQ